MFLIFLDNSEINELFTFIYSSIIYFNSRFNYKYSINELSLKSLNT